MHYHLEEREVRGRCTPCGRKRKEGNLQHCSISEKKEEKK